MATNTCIITGNAASITCGRSAVIRCPHFYKQRCVFQRQGESLANSHSQALLQTVNFKQFVHCYSIHRYTMSYIVIGNCFSSRGTRRGPSLSHKSKPNNGYAKLSASEQSQKCINVECMHKKTHLLVLIYAVIF